MSDTPLTDDVYQIYEYPALCRKLEQRNTAALKLIESPSCDVIPYRLRKTLSEILKGDK